jgi:hypothetical protein
MSDDPRSFSRRFGYHAPGKEITIREDAPEELRDALVMLADNYLNPANMRLEVCGILLVTPDPNNWTNYPNVFDEVKRLVRSCAWHRVYDIAEGFYDRVHSNNPEHSAEFEDRLNDFFVENGIGWAMKRDALLPVDLRHSQRLRLRP